MSLITLVLSASLLYIFCYRKLTVKKRYLMLLAMTCAVEILNMGAPFFKFGTASVSSMIVFESMLFIYSFKLLKNIRVSTKLFFWCSLFILLCILGVSLEIIFPYEKPIVNHSTYLAWDGVFWGLSSKSMLEISWGWEALIFYKVVFFLSELVVISQIIDLKDLRYLLRLITKIVYIDVYVGIAEFLFTYFVPILSTPFHFLIQGGNSTENIARYDVLGLSGLESEPSHFIITLFMLSLCMFIINKSNQKTVYRWYHFLPIYFLMIVSTGFSVVFLLPMSILCYLIIKLFNQSVSIRKVMTTSAIVIFILVAFYILINYLSENYVYIHSKLEYTQFALEYILSGGTFYASPYTSSSYARLVSIYDTFGDFIERPLLGLGLGIETSHGGLMNVLSFIGLSGIITLYFLIHRALPKGIIKVDKKLLFFYVCIVNLPLELYISGFQIAHFIIYASTALYMTQSKEGDSHHE